MSKKLGSPPVWWVTEMVKEIGPLVGDPKKHALKIWFKNLDSETRDIIIKSGKGPKMATKKRKRKATPAQMKALRKAWAANRKTRRSATHKRKSTTTTKRRRLSGPSKKKRSSTMSKTRRYARRAGGRVMKVAEAFGLGAAGAVLAGIVANMVPGDKRIKSLVPLGIGGVTMAAMRDKRAQAVGVGMGIAGTVSTIRTWFPDVPVLAGDDKVCLPAYMNNNSMGDQMMLAGNDSKMNGPVSLFDTPRPFKTTADV